MATIVKREGRDKPWQVRWRDPSGKQRSRQFARKVDAQRFATTTEADMLRGAYVDPAAGRVTFKTFAEAWLKAQTVDAKTIDGLTSHLRAHLIPAFGDLELRGIRPSTVQQWVAAVSRRLKPSYVKLLLSTLRSIMSAAVEDGIIAKNPCASKSVSAPPPERRRIVPWTVAQVCLATAAMAERYRATAIVAAGCGLRQGEVFGLRVCDVDFLRHRLEVRQQVKHVTGKGNIVAPPKRGKTRTVPLPDTVAAALADHLRTFPAERDDLVFTNTAGGPINRGSFNDRVWKPAVAAAGLPPTRVNGFHALRHHYASVLLEDGVTIRALAEYLGHEDPGFTLRVYTHLMPASEDRARHAVDRAYANSRAPAVHQG